MSLSGSSKKKQMDYKLSVTEVYNLFEQLTAEEINDLYGMMTRAEQNEFEKLVSTSPPRALMPYQVVPLEQTWWEIFLLIGGRGLGKTVTGATAVRNHLVAV